MPARRRRWGLPAVSRGYARPRGWLPSPYSPLRHCPLRGVRLACLIHAANVHSEPGSNPSQWSRPTLTPGGAPRRPIPTSKRLRNSDWSHRDGFQGAWQPPPRPTPVHAGHPAAEAHRTRWTSRPGTAARTPAPLKGRSQRDGGSLLPSCARFSLTLVLADDCNRPDCQRTATQEILRRRPTVCSSRRHHRPVQTASQQLAPAVVRQTSISEDLLIVASPSAEVKWSAVVFPKIPAVRLASHSDKIGKNNRARRFDQ